MATYHHPPAPQHGNAKYEHSILRAAGGLDWKPLVEEAKAKFTEAGEQLECGVAFVPRRFVWEQGERQVHAQCIRAAACRPGWCQAAAPTAHPQGAAGAGVEAA